MAYFEIIWDEGPDGNVEHLAEHDLTPEDVEEVIFNPVDRDIVRSANCVWIHTRRKVHLGCLRTDR